MNDEYIELMKYKGQQVYYNIKKNQVYIEKDNHYLLRPTMEERRALIHDGLVKKVLDIIKERIEIKK